MMTIDTISGLGKMFALVASKATVIEKTLTNYSEELEARRICQRTRKQLLHLSDEQLRDIGISRGDAEAEARRSFWD